MGKELQASLIRISYTFHLLLLAFAVTVRGELGFMNIDCGKPRDYAGTDGVTGLHYESDHKYVDTGITHTISSVFQGASVPSQAYDLRSFPEGERNCYSLTPVTPGKKYLVRASFLYGNYDGKNDFPKFDLHLGTIPWDTISISSSSLTLDTTIYSVASSDYMFVCLINTGSGTPFISNLELRPLDDRIYSKHVNASNSISMVSVDLVNFGGSTDSVVRFPNDQFDRLWRPYVKPGWTILSLSNTLDVGVEDSRFSVPDEVMKTAVEPTIGSTLTFSTDKVGNSIAYSSKYYVFMYFAELQPLSMNASRIFKVFRNGEQILNQSITLNNIKSDDYIYSTKPAYFSKLDHSLQMTIGSTRPPMINALEVYKVIELKQESTRSGDDKAIRDIKAFYRLMKNWNGDPCAPRKYTWDGLVCNYDDASPKIITLNLNASGLTGFFRRSICDLTELRELDLSTNKLKGQIPSCLAQLQKLTLLNLTKSGLQGPIPKSLLDRRDEDGSLVISFEDKPEPIQTPKKDAEKQKANNTVIIAIAVSVSTVVLLVMIAFCIFCIVRHRKNKKQENVSVCVNEKNQNTTLDQQDISPNISECQRFTYSELVKITKNFSNKVGEGGFGSVYHGILPNKVPVAVKLLSPASCQGPKEFQREAQILMKINHRNLVPFVGYCNDGKDHLALVYEYMTQGDLAAHISGKSHILSWIDRLRIATEAATGLEYLHKGCALNIIHRDIKTSNILLDHNFEAKIADFGLSRTCNNETFTQVTTTIMGTRGYLDPFSLVLDQRSDVYAFGIVLLELISGQPAIILKGGKSVLISDWANEHYSRGNLNSIVDNRFQGNYNASAVWKTLQTAIACVAPYVNGRPDMSTVVILLKECIQMEHVSFTTSSNNSVVTNNFATDSFFPGNENVTIPPSAR